MVKKLSILLLLLSSPMAICSSGDSTLPELYRPEKISFNQFHQEINKSAPYIVRRSNSVSSDLQIEGVARPVDFNKHYLLSVSDLLQVDFDKLKDLTQTEKILEAYETLYDRFEFNSTEGNFKYPYAINEYWDILATPPVKKLDRPLAAYSERYSLENRGNDQLISYEFNKELNEITDSDISYDNKTKLLQNGEFYSEKLRLIDSAQDFILASNMFLTCDYTQKPLIKSLKRKIKSGVKVFYILDKTFALKYRKCFRKIKRLGVKMIYLRHGLKVKKRDVYHNKFWIFDNKTALVYGANLLDSQVLADGFNRMYRDTGILLQGPIVRDLTREYIEIAQHLKKLPIKALKRIRRDNDKRITQEHISGKRGLENYHEAVAKSKGQGMCRVVFQGRNNNMKNISKLYRFLIESANSNIFLSMVRLTDKSDENGDKTTNELLNLMVDRANEDKVNIDIMTNNWMTATTVKSVNYKDSGPFTWLYKRFVKREDMRLVATEARKHFRKIAPSNFKIWNYFQFNHSKTMMIDNTLSIIGSYNLNQVSAEKSYEMAVVCHDSTLNNDFNHSITLDLLNSIPLLRGRN